MLLWTVICLTNFQRFLVRGAPNSLQIERLWVSDLNLPGSKYRFATFSCFFVGLKHKLIRDSADFFFFFQILSLCLYPLSFVYSWDEIIPVQILLQVTFSRLLITPTPNLWTVSVSCIFLKMWCFNWAHDSAQLSSLNIVHVLQGYFCLQSSQQLCSLVSSYISDFLYHSSGEEEILSHSEWNLCLVPFSHLLKL